MAATESSVVVALKEVRRLELERQRREQETRRAQEEAGRNDGSASVQYGPGIVPFGANGWSTEGLPEGFRPVHRTSEVMTVAPQQAFAPPQSYVGAGHAPPAWEGPGFVAAPAKKRSVIGPVLLTAVVCGAAALGGLWKLDGDHRAQLSLVEAGRQKAEQAKNEAVAAREKAEQELKLKVTEMETKANAAAAKAAAIAAAREKAAAAASATGEAPVAAAPAPLPAAGPRAGLRRARAAARTPMAAKPAAAPLPKVAPPPPAPAVAAPKVAKKKSLSDDPLGGLRL
jgi:hypothetical protein